MSILGLKQPCNDAPQGRLRASIPAFDPVKEPLPDLQAFARQTAGTQETLRETVDVSRSPRASVTLEQRLNEPGFLEVFPRTAGSRAPRLLTELETLVAEHSRMAERQASSAKAGVPQQRRPGGSITDNLALDCHRPAFDKFITAFGSYGPLLARIKAEFDSTVDTGIRCGWQNLELRQQLLASLADRKRAATAMNIEMSTGEQEWRQQMQGSIQEAREKLARVEKRASTAEHQLAAARAEWGKMQQQLEAMWADNERLQQLLETDRRWEASPEATSLASLPVGPLTQEDEDALLEAENASSASQEQRASKRQLLNDPSSISVAEPPLAEPSEGGPLVGSSRDTESLDLERGMSTAESLRPTLSSLDSYPVGGGSSDVVRPIVGSDEDVLVGRSSIAGGGEDGSSAAPLPVPG